MTDIKTLLFNSFVKQLRSCTDNYMNEDFSRGEVSVLGKIAVEVFDDMMKEEEPPVIPKESFGKEARDVLFLEKKEESFSFPICAELEDGFTFSCKDHTEDYKSGFWGGFRICHHIIRNLWEDHRRDHTL